MGARCGGRVWGVGAGVILGVVVAFCAVACVIETEVPKRPPLLRDTLRARAAASAVVVISVPPPVPDAFRTCEADADCVALLPNGCCHDGRSEALNKSLVDAYRSAFTCPVASPVCPMHLVLDRRVAACDVGAHQCKLVDPPP